MVAIERGREEEKRREVAEREREIVAEQAAQVHREKDEAMTRLQRSEQEARQQAERGREEAERQARMSERRAQEAENEVKELGSQWVVRREEIELTSVELGRGGWGVVMVANLRGTQVAAKCFYEDLASDYY